MRLQVHPFLLIQAMFFGAALPLCFALYVQYVQHLPPCPFCIYQRYPYVLVLVLAIFALIGMRYKEWVQMQAVFAVLAWLTTSGLGFYHFGIEQGWVDYQGECVSSAVSSTSLEDLKAQIASAPLVSCAEVGWDFLGISMPFWNGVTGLVLALGMLYMLRMARRQA
ncbi:MAG: disulfide bond formation protein B [Alphaproteobacteria bacterium]|nr:disulfide bond formation protein B [Alphaproteobacteria bacterium]